MLQFISSALIILVLSAIIALIITGMIKDKKKGKSSGCGCGCGGCAMRGICHSAQSPKADTEKTSASGKT